MSDRNDGVNINMSDIPVAGVGGLGLVAIALLIAYVIPAARWLLIAGVAGGVLLAGVIIAWRRLHRSHHPDGGHPAVLFREEPAVAGDRKAPRREPMERLATAH